ncbi:MAG TPA: Gfo/Idh/MocA family oxidoreductase [Pseudomonadales bacterium]|nr:Gfo/Idh/MocA family oxidoreductase [Pseudomonadales bacterium]
MPDIKRYAIVGTGGRYAMYLRAIQREFSNCAQLTGLCDINEHRARVAADYAVKLGGESVPTFAADDFDRMVKETGPDIVIVTSVDRTHDKYIIRAMELGCDVVSEKPMTVTAEKCQAILDAIKSTGRNLRVTFNYRYAPRASQVKELLMQKVVGNIKSVHFEWLLDTRHGADYFRRWHRDKRNSGGLLVHKATHHFDLVNWWLDSYPKTVFAMGGLVFYGRDNAESRGITKFYNRGTDDPNAKGDPFALNLKNDKRLKQIYYDAEYADGYRRDQSVFSDGISIEDDMAVMVRYENDVTMSYHLTAYSPWEGYRIAFNGDQGRLEFEVHENSYISGAQDDANIAENRDVAEIHEPAKILVRPHWQRPYEVELKRSNEGGHGGADVRLLQDVFMPGADDPLGRAANHIDGAKSILTGIAANKSLATGLPVDVRALVDF